MSEESYFGSVYPRPDDDLAAGILVCSRKAASQNIATTAGRTYYHFFTAYKSITVSKVVMATATTAAGATPTLVRMGLSVVDASDNATLVARTANDTALFAGSNTEYEKAFDTTGGFPASYDIVAGQRYALVWLVVSGAQSPSFQGVGATVGSTATATRAPRTGGYQSGQTDIQTTQVTSYTAANAHALGMFVA